MPSRDPVLGYIHDQAQQYGYGGTQAHEPGKSVEELCAELQQRTKAVADALYPHFTYSDHARFANATLPFVHRALGVKPAQNSDNARHMLMTYLIGISGIRDYLIDIERECWVLLQLSHDPRFNPHRLEPAMRAGAGAGMGWAAQQAGIVGIERQALKRRKAHKARVLKAIEEGKPLPEDAMTPVIMPFRALDMLDLPKTNLNRYAERFDAVTPGEARRLKEKREETREAINKLFKSARGNRWAGHAKKPKPAPKNSVSKNGKPLGRPWTAADRERENQKKLARKVARKA